MMFCLPTKCRYVQTTLFRIVLQEKVGTIRIYDHPTSGGFRAAMLPGQVTRAARAVSSWVEKNSVPPLINGRALDWSVVLTIGRLCPIVLQDNIVVSNKHN